MMSYAEMARERKKARPLFLELRALDLELHIKEDPADLTGYRLAITGLRSLRPAHADRIQRRAEDSKLGLLKVLRARWDENSRPCGWRGAWRPVPTRT
jgi:hypothetical protein